MTYVDYSSLEEREVYDYAAADIDTNKKKVATYIEDNPTLQEVIDNLKN